MKLSCIFWTVILTAVCAMHVHAFIDDFEREMEQLLDDMAYEDDNLGVSGNSADAFLRSLSTSAEIDEYISVCLYLVLGSYVAIGYYALIAPNPYYRR